MLRDLDVSRLTVARLIPSDIYSVVESHHVQSFKDRDGAIKGGLTISVSLFSGEPGLVDRVPALHAGSRGFDSHRGHTSERFFPIQ